MNLNRHHLAWCSTKRFPTHCELCQRPYQAEWNGSRQITEVKQRWAWIVLGWETAWEHQVLLTFCSHLCKKTFFLQEIGCLLKFYQTIIQPVCQILEIIYYFLTQTLHCKQKAGNSMFKTSFSMIKLILIDWFRCKCPKKRCSKVIAQATPGTAIQLTL